MAIKIIIHINRGIYFIKLGNGVIWILKFYKMYDIKILVRIETLV